MFPERLPGAILIVGDDAATGRAIRTLLRSSGRRAAHLDGDAAAWLGGAMEGIDMVVLLPDIVGLRRTAILSQFGDLPIVELSHGWAGTPWHWE